MSETTKLFNDALALEEPWFVERSEFDVKRRQLVVHLNFEAGGLLRCAGRPSGRNPLYGEGPASLAIVPWTIAHSRSAPSCVTNTSHRQTACLRPQ